jgi:hypothetical protein
MKGSLEEAECKVLEKFCSKTERDIRDSLLMIFLMEKVECFYVIIRFRMEYGKKATMYHNFDSVLLFLDLLKYRL